MPNYEQQITAVQHALRDPEPIGPNELLIPYNRAGQPARVMAPPPGVTPREAAALVLFYPHAGDLWLPLTVRSSALQQHRGEVSLPGGATDPEDGGSVATALRETSEELGIDSRPIEIWGQLTTIYIPPSNFRLTPVVGYTAVLPPLVPNPREIEALIHLPLRLLLDAQTVVVEEWTLQGAQVLVPFFAIEGYKVWGATALVLSELVARLRRLNMTLN